MNQSDFGLSDVNAKVFTLRSANAMLPLVRNIVMDIVELTDVISETRHRLDDMDEYCCERDEADVYSTELSAIRDSIDRQSDRVQECVGELNELSVYSRSLSDGYVDFPAVRDNEPVCLCWRPGDREILFWHKMNEDCGKRRPIDLTLIRQSGRIEVSSSL